MLANENTISAPNKIEDPISEKMKYLHIGMSRYRYIPKGSIPKNLKGFFTFFVCECVAGIISSDQGYGFFHYFKTNDPSNLQNLISRDFGNATSVKIILIGGNSNNLCLPWKVHNRELKLKKPDGSMLYGENALAQLVTIPENSISFASRQDEYYDMQAIFEENLTMLENKKRYIYDRSKINEILRDRKFVVHSHTSLGACSFEVKGVKDFVGYQNVEAVKKVCAIFDLNVVHYNCRLGSSVFADFDGNFGLLGVADEILDPHGLREFPSEQIESYEPFKARIKEQKLYTQGSS